MKKNKCLSGEGAEEPQRGGVCQVHRWMAGSKEQVQKLGGEYFKRTICNSSKNVLSVL